MRTRSEIDDANVRCRNTISEGTLQNTAQGKSRLHTARELTQLHLNFSHPSVEKLFFLLRRSGCANSTLEV